MGSNIIQRNEVKLNPSQTRMLISGWGEEAMENSVVEKITYLSDGLKVKGYIAYPKNIPAEKIPCIIWNRGGYENKGAIDHFTARGMFGNIASWGYIVFTSQYRGNDGSEGKEQIGGEDVNDVLNLIPLADEFSFADKEKWGMEGWSRGGMMTYLALLKNPDFKCAVITGGLSNLKQYAESSERLAPYYKEMLGEEKYLEELEKRTIITKAENLPDIPYLLMHGGADETVPVMQSIELAKKFNEMKYNYRLVIFEKGDHYLKTHRTEVGEMTKNWFKKYLK